MESVRDPRGEVDLCDRLEAGGIEEHEVGAVVGRIEHESHQHTIVLRGLGSVGHEHELAGRTARAEVVFFRDTGREVVLGIQALKRLARRLNVSADVIFTGPVPWPELPSYYDAADVFAAI